MPFRPYQRRVSRTRHGARLSAAVSLLFRVPLLPARGAKGVCELVDAVGRSVEVHPVDRTALLRAPYCGVEHVDEVVGHAVSDDLSEAGALGLDRRLHALGPQAGGDAALECAGERAGVA